MYSAISIFSTAIDDVQNNFCSGINEFLKAVGASKSSGGGMADSHDLDLPFFAKLEKHEFQLGKSLSCWLELVEQKEKPLQFFIRLQYPKRKWFAPRARDWKKIVAEAQNHFGQGQLMNMRDKTLMHFIHQDKKLLISSYDTRKYQLIEMKMAAGQFCY